MSLFALQDGKNIVRSWVEEQQCEWNIDSR